MPAPLRIAVVGSDRRQVMIDPITMITNTHIPYTRHALHVGHAYSSIDAIFFLTVTYVQSSTTSESYRTHG